MVGPSVLSTLHNFPISNTFYYDNSDRAGSLLAMDSSSRLDMPALNMPMLPSSNRPKSSFETTVFPGELAI